MRVTISRRDTADTAITAELLDSSLHVHSFSLSPGTEVGTSSAIKKNHQDGYSKPTYHHNYGSKVHSKHLSFLKGKGTSLPWEIGI